MSDMLAGIAWLRGSSVRIRRTGVEIHVDPMGVDEEARADFILLTHPHYDNFSEDGIDRVRHADTVVVAPATMKKQLALQASSQQASSQQPTSQQPPSSTATSWAVTGPASRQQAAIARRLVKSVFIRSILS